MNGPEVITAAAAITIMGVYAALAGHDLLRDWQQRREVRRLERHAAGRRRLSRPRSLP